MSKNDPGKHFDIDRKSLRRVHENRKGKRNDSEVFDSDLGARPQVHNRLRGIRKIAIVFGVGLSFVVIMVIVAISGIATMTSRPIGKDRAIKYEQSSTADLVRKYGAKTPSPPSQQSVNTAPVESASAPPPDASAIKELMTPDQLALGDPVVNSVGMVLVPIPAGEFQMGSPESEHLVKITKAYYLGAYEVTQEQYEKVMGKNLSHSKGDTKPVENVSWNDAIEFCRKLSKEEGVEYRLPTEAEWEYACRAGTTTGYSFGDNVSQLGEYAWYRNNSERRTHAVGEKLPNAWGLYDMHGNVGEWCQDWFEQYGKETALVDPTGPARGIGRVLRGGAFSDLPQLVRSADRFFNLPDDRNTYDGFRLARTYNLSP